MTVTRFRILTVAALERATVGDRLFVVEQVIPWLAELAMHAHAMRPVPWVRDHGQFGMLVDVAAVRWRSETAPEICYPTASYRDPTRATRTISPSTGDSVFVHGWSPAVVAPPERLLSWAEWDEANGFPQLRAGRPESPRDRALAALGGAQGRFPSGSR